MADSNSKKPAGPHPLRAVFAEHASPKHCSKRQVHDGLRPVAGLVADMKKQMIEYRAVLDESTLADDSLAGKAEHIHQTIEAADREIGNLERAQRNVAKIFTQLDVYLNEQHQAIADRLAGGT